MSKTIDEGAGFESALAGYSKVSKGALRNPQSVGMALGSVAALAVCSTEAEAVVLIADVNQSFGPSTTSLFDVNEDADLDFEFAGDNDPIYPFVKMGARNGLQVIGRQVGGYFYASRLASGASVSAGLNFLPADPGLDKLMAFTYNGSSEGGDWLGGGTGFIGFSVPDVGGVRYGWVEVTVNLDGVSGTVLRYGLEGEVNTPVIAGVPEANSLACLAMGAAGLLGWRQRRKTA